MPNGVGTGPSAGFLNRLMREMPGALNAAGQQFGGPGLSQAARGTSGLLRDGGKSWWRRGQQAPQIPQIPQQNPQSVSPLRDFVQPPPLLGQNTGITGGMFPSSPMNPSMGPPSMPSGPMGGGGGFWNTFQRMSPQMGMGMNPQMGMNPSMGNMGNMGMAMNRPFFR
jgi:hypothetical protein